MNELLVIFRVIGSIAVCMVGFGIITDTLLSRFSPWFQRLIESRKADRIHGFLNGSLAAALTGSSSSGVVFLISMVESSLVSLKKTPWILLGINLGATLTGWIIAFGAFHMGMTRFALVILAAALPFKISSYLSQYKYGDALTGIGLLMLGIDLLIGCVQLFPYALEGLPYLEMFSGLGGFVSAFGFGVLFSFLIQSTIGVQILAMTLAFRGWLPFDLAAAMVLGSNLGMTITGFLAASSLGIQSRRTACIHLMINLVCCIWASLLFSFLVLLTDSVLSGFQSSSSIPYRLALFQTVIHLVNPLAVSALSPLIMKGCIVCVSSRRTAKDEGSLRPLNLLPKNLPDSLASNIVLVQSGLVQMAKWAYEMLMMVMNTSQGIGSAEEQQKKINDRMKSLELMDKEISNAGTVSVQQPCTRQQAEKIQHQIRVSQELKDIGEACSKGMNLLAGSSSGRYRFHEESGDELFDFISQILDFLGYINDYLEDKITYPDVELAKNMEDAIDTVRDTLKKRSRKFLEGNHEIQVKGELAFIEIIGYLEHIGDSCLRISETIPKMKAAAKNR